MTKGLRPGWSLVPLDDQKRRFFHGALYDGKKRVWTCTHNHVMTSSSFARDQHMTAFAYAQLELTQRILDEKRGETV